MTCRCGCGAEATTSTGWKYGHWLVGLKRSPRTEEHRRKLGLSLMGKSRERMLGAGNPMYGKPAPNRNKNQEEQKLKVKLRKTCHHLLGKILARSFGKKTGRTHEMLGYTPEQLRLHLEKQFAQGMSWANHGLGPGCWNIDHIKEIKTFPITASPKEVNALDNLRPLWHEENQARNRKNKDA